MHVVLVVSSIVGRIFEIDLKQPSNSRPGILPWMWPTKQVTSFESLVGSLPINICLSGCPAPPDKQPFLQAEREVTIMFPRKSHHPPVPPHHSGPPHHHPHHPPPSPHHSGVDRWNPPLPDGTDQVLLNDMFSEEPEKANSVYRLFQHCPSEIAAIASLVLRLGERIEALRIELNRATVLQVTGKEAHEQSQP